MESIEKLRESSHLDDDKWTFDDGVVMRMYGSEPNEPGAVNWGEQWRKIADEIEAEIERGYMKLPVDADGVPIHIGDRLETFGCPPQDYDVFDVYGFCTTAINGVDWYVIDGYDQQCDVKGVRHVKPRTLESILCDALADVSCMGDGIVRRFKPDEPYVAELAAEIRELMEVGK